jgi:hypothetical protein
MSPRDLSPEARRIQDAIWATRTAAEKIELTGRLWLQARNLKRATLRSMHPDWTDARIEEVVREAMRGRRD